MIVKTAWKNVWRNKTRSLVVISSIVVGVFAGVYSIAFMNGMIVQRVDSALSNEVAHIQINHKNFRSNNDIQDIIQNGDEVYRKIQNTDGVAAISRRTVITGMANTASKSTGVQVIGVNPDDERNVFKLYDKVIKETGSYLTPEKHNVAFVGEALAKELNIIRYEINDLVIDSLRKLEIPEEVIGKLEQFKGKRFKNEKLFFKKVKAELTEKESASFGRHIAKTSQRFRSRAKLTMTFLDKNNDQTGGNFRIAGLYNLPNNMYEKMQVFVLNEDLKALTGLEAYEYHQYLVKINDTEFTNEVTQSLRESFLDLEVLNWKEIAPDLAMTEDMVTQFYIVFMSIILAALAFGILNTMLMVVLERTKELGMLTAIGMNKRRVFSMIMLESIFLSLVGGVLGMLVSKIAIDISYAKGLNFANWEEGMEAMGYSSVIYPTIEPYWFVVMGVMIAITGMISSIYPAYKALKLDPAEAIRTE
jgi:putative ABC transport system permease protein